ncbi:MAG: flagellar biosynthetic protein FliR [Gudongella sp.]|nr:flagellar biosynthetic protein FliR [Gudongella sp.]
MIIQIQKLILIMMRITAFMVTSPGYSFRGIPNILKVAISGVVTIFIYMALPDMAIVGGISEFAFLAIKETIFGLSIGFVTQMIFSTIEMAGKLIDFQVGFSMGAVYDPAMGAQASNYGRTYYWIAIAIFFLLDMHQLLLEMVIRSYEFMPIGSVSIEKFNPEAIVVIFSRVFELSINLAAPMIITVLITDVVLGLISRTVPQINVFMLGMPMKSMVSFLVFLVSISWIMNSAGNIIETIPKYIEGVMVLF